MFRVCDEEFRGYGCPSDPHLFVNWWNSVVDNIPCKQDNNYGDNCHGKLSYTYFQAITMNSIPLCMNIMLFIYALYVEVSVRVVDVVGFFIGGFFIGVAAEVWTLKPHSFRLDY